MVSRADDRQMNEPYDGAVLGDPRNYRGNQAIRAMAAQERQHRWGGLSPTHQLIVGAAGSGRSATLGVLAADARQQGFACVRVRLGAGDTFAEQVAHQVRDMARKSWWGKLKDALRPDSVGAQVGLGGSRVTASKTTGAQQPGHAWELAEALTKAAERAHKRGQQGLAILVDDAHLASPEDLAVLRGTLARLDETRGRDAAPISLAMTATPTGASALGEAGLPLSSFRVENTARLTPDEAGAALHGMMQARGIQLSPYAHAQLVQGSLGLPRQLEQLATAATGYARFGPQGAFVTDADARDIVMNQLRGRDMALRSTIERLPAEERRVLQAMSASAAAGQDVVTVDQMRALGAQTEGMSTDDTARKLWERGLLEPVEQPGPRRGDAFPVGYRYSPELADAVGRTGQSTLGGPGRQPGLPPGMAQPQAPALPQGPDLPQGAALSQPTPPRADQQLEAAWGRPSASADQRSAPLGAADTPTHRQTPSTQAHSAQDQAQPHGTAAESQPGPGATASEHPWARRDAQPGVVNEPTGAAPRRAAMFDAEGTRIRPERQGPAAGLTRAIAARQNAGERTSSGPSSRLPGARAVKPPTRDDHGM